MADNVQKTIIYKWQSYVDDNYGLIWANDTDKPAYNALLQAGPALAQTTPIPEQLSFNIPIFQNTLRIYAFKSVNTNQYVLAMWAEDNRQIGVSISINAAALISSESEIILQVNHNSSNDWQTEGLQKILGSLQLSNVPIFVIINTSSPLTQIGINVGWDLSMILAFVLIPLLGIISVIALITLTKNAHNHRDQMKD